MSKHRPLPTGISGGTAPAAALTLLLTVNLLNYIDRQVLYAIFPLLKAELRLSDTALGFLGSSFMLCYMISAPPLGWIGDRWRRTRLCSVGIAVWSAATALAGVAGTYQGLLAARTAVGIGEASFGTASPGLLADYYPKERRGRVLALFFLAIPVGSALGYLLGGVIGQTWGWHAAFLFVGAPGLALAIPVWRLRDPPRTAEGVDSSSPPHRYAELLGNRSFISGTLSMAAMTFALGGLAQWLPSFLNRIHGLSVAKGNTVFGAITVVTGIAGTLAGGWLGDRLQQRSGKGYLLVSGWGFLLGVPFAVVALLAPALPLCLAAIAVAEFFLFLNTGPLNTVIVNVSPPAIRSMTFAVNIFFIHALGDAISPTVIGWLSDRWGLQHALLVAPLAILLAAAFSFLCCRTVERDTASAER